MKAIIQLVPNYFLIDTETKVKVPITEEEFKKEYLHKTEYPRATDKGEIVYVLKGSKYEEFDIDFDSVIKENLPFRIKLEKEDCKPNDFWY